MSQLQFKDKGTLIGHSGSCFCWSWSRRLVVPAREWLEDLALKAGLDGIRNYPGGRGDSSFNFYWHNIVIILKWPTMFAHDFSKAFKPESLRFLAKNKNCIINYHFQNICVTLNYRLNMVTISARLLKILKMSWALSRHMEKRFLRGKLDFPS